MKPLDRLARDQRVSNVDADGALAFAREPAPGVLLLPGDPTRPEVVDVAVVMSELLSTHPALRYGVAPVGDEPAMRERFGVTSFPALLFVKNGEVAKVLARMQTWSTYEGAASAIEVTS
jgi:hydrogenase-1 operon protein HyaE